MKTQKQTVQEAIAQRNSEALKRIAKTNKTVDQVLTEMEEHKRAYLKAYTSCPEITFDYIGKIYGLEPAVVMGVARALNVVLYNPTETINYYWCRLKVEENFFIEINSKK